MQVLPTQTYLTTLLQHINTAKHTIVLATMTFDAEPPVTDILAALHHAQQRGVRVKLYVDVFSKLPIHYGILTRHSFLAQQRLRQALATLESGGATVVWLGKISLNPFRQRFHQKFSIIDEEMVFFSGGVNLSGRAFDNQDFMLQLKSPETAQILQQNVRAIAAKGNIADSQHDLDETTTLLCDGGQPHQSIIYDNILQLVLQAEHITYISQMAPAGTLAQALQGKSVSYYLNPPSKMAFPDLIAEYISHWRYKYRNSYTSDRYLHAKCMLFTMKNGQEIIIAGSHNFNQRGVNYGTKEIAVLSHDKNLWQQMADYVQQLND